MKKSLRHSADPSVSGDRKHSAKLAAAVAVGSVLLAACSTPSRTIPGAGTRNSVASTGEAATPVPLPREKVSNSVEYLTVSARQVAASIIEDLKNQQEKGNLEDLQSEGTVGINNDKVAKATQKPRVSATYDPLKRKLRFSSEQPSIASVSASFYVFTDKAIQLGAAASQGKLLSLDDLESFMTDNRDDLRLADVSLRVDSDPNLKYGVGYSISNTGHMDKDGFGQIPVAQELPVALELSDRLIAAQQELDSLLR